MLVTHPASVKAGTVELSVNMYFVDVPDAVKLLIDIVKYPVSGIVKAVITGAVTSL